MADAAFFDALGDVARRAIAGVADLAPDNKQASGFDPVTEADRSAERAMRDAIAARFPHDAIWGEEYGWTNDGAAQTWSLDPIDGTRAFICGLPSWAVLVGLLEGDEHVGGMIDLPDMDLRLIGCDGQTMANGERVTASGCTNLGEAKIATTDPYIFDSAVRARFEQLQDTARLTRFGMDAMAFAKVATGHLDMAFEWGLQRHDYDALVAVVRGAGGHVGNWSGGDDLTGGDVIAAATRTLYDQAVEALA